MRALTLALALAAPAALAAQEDTLARVRDTLPPPARDTITADTAPVRFQRPPLPVPAGPLPAGRRIVYDADSLLFGNLHTLSDLLAHVPGVHVARGGFYGQPEPVQFGGRGAAGLEIYWDGVPYIPLGRDSVYIDPARIPLGPLERVEVHVLPGVVRVYLVSATPRSTEPVTAIHIATGRHDYALYRAGFARRWRSGLGLSLHYDQGATDGIQASEHTKFRATALWGRLDYAPSPRWGAEAQWLSNEWKRDPGAHAIGGRETTRTDYLLRALYRRRQDGLGARAQIAFAASSISPDTALAVDSGAAEGRSERQAILELAHTWRRSSISARAIFAGERIPFRADVAASWSPVGPLTLAGEARRLHYAGERRGERLYLGAGLALPVGFALRGEAAVARDLAAPAVATDSLQETTDYAAGLRWERSFITLDVEAGRRGAFTPVGFATDLRPVAALGPAPLTEYVRGSLSLRPLPGLHLSGWYAEPLSGGADFEPPRRARYAATFQSRFWRKFRSGAFTLYAEVAGESWSGGTGGRDSLGALLPLRGATLLETNLRIRILGITLFWVVRNINLSRRGYLPGRDYPRGTEYYGASWTFTN